MTSRNTMTVARRLTVAFGSVTAVFLLVGASALYSGAKLAEADEWNTHTYRVLDTSGSMLTSMINMETGIRGYLVAGDTRFLEPWTAGREDFKRAWTEAKRLTADNAEQQRRLDAMQQQVDAFAAVADSNRRLREDVATGKKPMQDMVEQFSAAKDKAAMDAFRALQNDFSKAESGLLATRSTAAADLRTLNRSVVLGGSLLAVVGSILLGLWVTRRIVRQLGGEPDYAAEVVRRIADGDLTTEVQVPAGDTTSLLATMRTMQQRLGGVVAEIRGGSDSIATGSTQIATGNADLSQRTEEQASNLQQTAASMEQLSSTIKNNADTANQAIQLASGASQAAGKGGEVVGRVVATMEEITTSSKRISEIIGVIDGIAFQTNILALNAAVEAARAGDQGRGFAVVAGEVRSLAQRSAEAAKEIKTLIGASVETVETGARLVNEAGQTMGDIVQQVSRVTDLINEIGAATQEQTSGIEQMNLAVSQLDQVTQQNAALVEESAAAADSLQQQAEKLVDAVSVFRLPQDAAAARVIAKAKAVAPAVVTAPRPAPAAPRKAKAEPATEEWASF